MELIIIIVVLIVLGMYWAKRDSQFAETLGSCGNAVGVVVAVTLFVLWMLFGLVAIAAAVIGAIAAAVNHEPLWLGLALPLGAVVLLSWLGQLKEQLAERCQQGPWSKQ
ncbi:MAG TPA: hypothetical protein VHT52_11975 [Stellaceae bacterium]|jgi:hypothetical protein|nr:hypothetical protein [Stellaceae bacterium]